MKFRKRGGLGFAAALTISMIFSSPAALAAGGGGGSGGGGGGGGGSTGTGSLYSDLVVELRAQDGTPMLKEYAVPGAEATDPATIEYCVQPVSYTAVPGVAPTTNPLDGRQVWVLPLQGEWIDHPVDPLPVAEIEACDPKPQYAMFVAETELERLNLTRTSDTVLEQKKADVQTKLTLAHTIGLDPAGRLTADGVPVDAAPEYAGIYDSLMKTGSIAGLNFADIPYDRWQLAAVALGAAASKGVPITVDTVQYYNRIVGFTVGDSLPTWPGLSFITPQDPNPATPMAVDVLPGGENFVDYQNFTYSRAKTFIGSVTWMDVPQLKWMVNRILDVVPWTNLGATGNLSKAEVDGRTLTGVTAFAQMADDTRSVINYLHEHDQIVPGFYMDPVLTDTTAQQIKNTTDPAVQLVAPATVFKTLAFPTTASLLNPWGGSLVDTARLRITVDAPQALNAGDVTATAPGGSVAFTAGADGNLVGWWGPPQGFAVPPGYNVDTSFDVTVGGAAPVGPYAVRVQLVNVDAPNTVLAEDVSTVNVNDSATTVLWGAEIPALATQGSYVSVPVRVYAPTDQNGVLTFTLTGPPDDPTTDLLEQLAAGDATVFGSNGTDMVAMPLTLSDNVLSGTWPMSLKAGYNDVTWYLLVADGATVGQYGIDVGLQSGTDLAEPQYVSFAAPESHGQKPPGAGDDTTVPVVTFTSVALTADSATFDFAANEPSTLATQLTVNGVKGAWEPTTATSMAYRGLQAGNYVFAVKATDVAGNVATYIKKFVIVSDTRVLSGPADRSWVLGTSATFTLGSNASSASYQTLVNGVAKPVSGSGTIRLSGLRQGVNKIVFTAVTASGADPSPVVRTVYLPIGSDRLAHTRAWTAGSRPAALYGRYLSTTRRGQSVSFHSSTVKRIALVATRSPRAGKVHVYLNGRRITDRPISLASRTFASKRLIPVKTFSSARSGWVKVQVVSRGKPVRVEGIGLATR